MLKRRIITSLLSCRRIQVRFFNFYDQVPQMGQANTNTAILIFSLSARREAERKTLFGKRGKKTTESFFDMLIELTKTTASRTGADVVVVDEHQQKGRSFGERYANAFQELFDQGYDKVISIGNDTPDLTSDILGEAIGRMQQNDLLVGPSSDGGVYLLGMHREFFKLEEFKALPWLQSDLLKTMLSGSFSKGAQTHCLEELSDIDTVRQLLQFAYSSEDAVLVDFILNHLLVYTDRTFKGAVLLYANDHALSSYLRGPPAFPIAA
ncbi:TIGR04282 family arsenosugar biosynthesis glycosyltransferase [Zobellia uliginosa]|uniref:TIGR04282 family arsenosugar biosynthesis glycosyltransferase n=1 Tax=Zobellia uliginosa TaxID=143224 RepID=UPI0026E1AA43|nr:DUF2064 domain-containing protein [Zobellia uliginosa]MDO6516187.1 DUF2064 domain-containing protein [Zobellia uliginosa]